MGQSLCGYSPAAASLDFGRTASKRGRCIETWNWCGMLRPAPPAGWTVGLGSWC